MNKLYHKMRGYKKGLSYDKGIKIERLLIVSFRIKFYFVLKFLGEFLRKVGV